MNAPPDRPEVRCDVAVLGGGLAGLAVATRLAREGVSVLSIDPGSASRLAVGESLDWSAPRLLGELGFPCERLIREGFATRKRHLRVQADDAPPFEMRPDPWVARRPLGLSVETVHLDRGRFDAALLEEAERAGVRFRREKVTRVAVDGDRVEALETATARIRARRYVDASGRARLLGRTFGLTRVEYGEPKVSAWTYLHTPPRGEGTTLHLDGSRDSLGWIWEIPIGGALHSVGLTLAASELRRRIDGRGSLERVLHEELVRVDRLRPWLPEAEALSVHARSFQCYVHERTSGPNWMLVGEAAAMLDPLTSGGVTFALRFGSHAAKTILGSLQRSAMPRSARRVYDLCLRSMAHASNEHIECAAYRPMLRTNLGTRRATHVYVAFAYVANSFYQRLDPRGIASVGLLRLVLMGFGLWRSAWTLAARARSLLGRARGVSRATPSPAPSTAETRVDWTLDPAPELGSGGRPTDLS